MENQATFGKRKISALLHKISFFEVFTHEEIDKLIEVGEWFKISAGKRIIKKGDSDRYLYILLHGQVEIILGCKVLGELKTGDMFGEFGLLGAMRTADVEATADCILMAFQGDNLNHLPLEIQVKFLKQVIHVMCNHLQQNNKNLWFSAPLKNAD